MPAGDTGDTADALSESADDDPSSSSSSSLARPPDGGWGWMVVLGSFFAHLIADGCAFSFGVLYVELLSQFGESKAKTAWVGSLFVSVPLLAGPVAGAATDHFGCRWTAVAGGLLATVGFIASSFAGSIGALCLTFGVLSGFALSLVYVPAVVIVAQHFEKRRAFTTGLAVAGSGIGTFVLAPLMEWLLKTYGWRGALLILAGLMLNLVVCGALYRPPPTLKRRRRPCQLVAPPAGTDSLARRFAALLPAGMTSKSLGQIPMAPPPCRAGEKRAVQRRGDTPPWVRQVASPLDRRNVFYRGRLPASRTTGWVSRPSARAACVAAAPRCCGRCAACCARCSTSPSSATGRSPSSARQTRCCTPRTTCRTSTHQTPPGSAGPCPSPPPPSSSPSSASPPPSARSPSGSAATGRACTFSTSTSC